MGEDTDRLERLRAVRPLARVSSIKVKLSIVIVAAVAVAAIMSQVGLRLGWPVWLRPVIAAALGLVMAQVLGRGMTRPLREMSIAARRLARGDYDARVETNSTDEVGELATAFTSMARQLAKSDQLRRDLVANVSHELRTPISALQATLENLQDGVIQGSPEVLATMHGHVERLGRLVRDLLELSRLEAGESPLHIERISAATLVEQVAADVNAHHPGAVLALPIDSTLSLSADPNRLRQALGNLAHNGVVHGGQHVTIAAERAGSSVRFTVSDDGPGIPEPERERVFERFYRADHSRSNGAGFGLGLAIVGWIVTLHGGTVAAHANEPRGCRMVVDIPDRAR